MDVVEIVSVEIVSVELFCAMSSDVKICKLSWRNKKDMAIILAALRRIWCVFPGLRRDV